MAGRSTRVPPVPPIPPTFPVSPLSPVSPVSPAESSSSSFAYIVRNKTDDTPSYICFSGAPGSRPGYKRVPRGWSIDKYDQVNRSWQYTDNKGGHWYGESDADAFSGRAYPTKVEQRGGINNQYDNQRTLTPKRSRYLRAEAAMGDISTTTHADESTMVKKHGLWCRMKSWFKGQRKTKSKVDKGKGLEVPNQLAWQCRGPEPPEPGMF